MTASRISAATRRACGRLGLRKQHGELVATDAPKRVGATKPGAQAACDLDQKLIADVMSSGVVDGLEVVEVEQEHRRAVPVALGVGDRALELVAKAPAVGQAGHLVVVGEKHEPFLELLALADVLDLGDELDGLAARVAYQRDAQQHPDDVAVAVEVALLHLVGAALAGQHLAHVFEIEIEILRVGDLLEGHPRQLGLRVSEQLAERLVDTQKGPLHRNQGDPDRGVIER